VSHNSAPQCAVKALDSSGVKLPDPATKNHGFCGFPSVSPRWYGRGAPQERQTGFLSTRNFRIFGWPTGISTETVLPPI